MQKYDHPLMITSDETVSMLWRRDEGFDGYPVTLENLKLLHEVLCPENLDCWVFTENAILSRSRDASFPKDRKPELLDDL